MNKKYIAGTIAAIGLVVVAIVTVDAMKTEYSDFRSPTTTGRRVQIAGTWVKQTPVRYDAEANQFHFTMRDTSGQIFPVVFAGAKPNNFELATSIVCTGEAQQGTLIASNILTKCPSKYESDGSELQDAATGGGKGAYGGEGGQ